MHPQNMGESEFIKVGRKKLCMVHFFRWTSSKKHSAVTFRPEQYLPEKKTTYHWPSVQWPSILFYCTVDSSFRAFTVNIFLSFWEILRNAWEECTLPKLPDRVLVKDGIDSSKFSDLSPLATLHSILTHLTLHVCKWLIFCLKMKRTSCSEVLAESQLSYITTSLDFCHFQARKTVFPQFLDKELFFALLC